MLEKNFSKEVRNVYYDKKNKKTFTEQQLLEEERKELKDEGIELATIPWIDDKEN